MSQITQTVSGWAMMAVAFLMSYIGEGIASFYIIFVVVFLDAVLGIVSSIRRGGFAFSYLARETLSKLGIYLIILFVVFMTEKTLPLNFVIATPCLAAIICTIELWSILAHVLILKPNMAIVHLLRKHLEGEIARKLGVSAGDVSEALNQIDEVEQQKEEK
ncbi:MAG: hypothetical protein SNI49_03320 [Rikenellaceae bacterium]